MLASWGGANADLTQQCDILMPIELPSAICLIMITSGSGPARFGQTIHAGVLGCVGFGLKNPQATVPAGME